MTQDKIIVARALVEQLVEALATCRVMGVDGAGNYTKEITPRVIQEALTSGQAALSNAPSTAVEAEQK